MFSPKILLELSLLLAIKYGGALLFFLVLFETTHHGRNKNQAERDKRAEAGFYLFSAAIALNFIVFTISGLYGGSSVKAHFLRLFLVLSNILILLASFAVVWGRKRILLQFSSIFLIACDAALLLCLVTTDLS